MPAGGARRLVFWLHVPARYDPLRLVPLVLAFHSGGGSGLGMQRVSGLSTLADQRGFPVAYPQGLAQNQGKDPDDRPDSGPVTKRHRRVRPGAGRARRRPRGAAGRYHGIHGVVVLRADPTLTILGTFHDLGVNAFGDNPGGSVPPIPADVARPPG